MKGYKLSFLSVLIPSICCFLASCQDGSIPYQSLPEDGASYSATVAINLDETFPFNRRLLGNNIQWVDRGDELLLGGTTDFSPVMLEKVIKLKPTVLRYPGGSLSDLYRWEGGIGSVRERRASSRFHNDGNDTILFGTKEFLSLSKLTGAEPLLTVNVVTAPIEETVGWLKKINVERFKDDSQGGLLPKVQFIEIGNEPYLIDDNQKELAITAAEFVATANELVPRLRAVDSSIKVGIPLRSDDFDGMPATPLPGFNQEVLEGFKDTIDFVALHNTYFPFLWNGVPSNEEQIYLASMAATSIVKKDLDRTRRQLKSIRPEENIPIAITEMSSMFSLGLGKSDTYIQSLAGTMYLADLLSLLSQEDNILMANFWSLTGNWEFGTIDSRGNERASYKVLEEFHEMQVGSHVKTTVSAPSFNIVETGFMTAQQGVSYLTVLGSFIDQGAGGKLSLWIVNKNPVKPADLSLDLNKAVSLTSYSIKTLTTNDYFSLPEANVMDWKEETGLRFSESNTIKLAPHSVNLITIEI